MIGEQDGYSFWQPEPAWSKQHCPERAGYNSALANSGLAVLLRSVDHCGDLPADTGTGF
jgi:hypothetical protein